MEFSRQEYWSGLPIPSPGNLRNSGIKPESPVLPADTVPLRFWEWWPVVLVFPSWLLKTLRQSFPGGPVVKIALQCKGHWFNPWWGKIPHTAEQLSLCVHHNYWASALQPASRNYWAYELQVLQPTCLEPMLHKRSHCNEKMSLKSRPHWPQLEKAHEQQWRPTTANK